MPLIASFQYGWINIFMELVEIIISIYLPPLYGRKLK